MVKGIKRKREEGSHILRTQLWCWTLQWLLRGRGPRPGKRLLLLREMLATFSYLDLGTVASIPVGFRITGYLSVAGVFDLEAEEDLKDPVDVNWLWQNARAIRVRIIRHMKEKQGCVPELQAELRRIALEEVANGWTEDPFHGGPGDRGVGAPLDSYPEIPGGPGPKCSTYRRFVRKLRERHCWVRDLLDLMSVVTLVAVCRLWRILRGDSAGMALRVT